jgi:hypothetical protein
MRFIILFLNLFLIESFHNEIFSKIQVSSIFKNMFGNNDDIIKEEPSYLSIDETNKKIMSGYIGFSNDLEITRKIDENEQDENVSIIVSKNLKKSNKVDEEGFDQREIGKTCLEKIYDSVQEKECLKKNRKYNYQMNLLKKLENREVGEFEKIRAIEEYNYIMESSKYISNIESGGLYSDWKNNDF